MANLSGTIVTPQLTVPLPAIQPGARAASFLVTLGVGATATLLTWANLPPQQKFGNAATVWVDNTENSQTAVVTFIDTGMSTDIPAGEAVWLVAVTGLQQLMLSSAVTGVTPINVQVLNCLVGPTGVTPVSGPVTVTNQGPINGAPASRSANWGAAAPHQIIAANPNRRFVLLQFPTTSDGYLNMIGGTAGPTDPDSLYMAPGEKYLSTGYVPTAAYSVWLTNGGTVPVYEG